ncbi:hypothetical protein KIH41_04725 [Litoribacter ruber]|uniref:Winged helix-turn-helix transcriptional regulator n=1 Tax=Litoribacter ruber TaxID=702568 RepID=A0AAP2CGQ9_9BACT|nr:MULTISPECIES: SatD family protein [Litoribacter]MBS9523259.1 hypothetical protein [Litoribacter alkaliphilus]MBT0810578.1 hypothetical protein [Litoribacter ruber]
MIAVIKGDIINSRAVENQAIWLEPLKKLLSEWGRANADWEILWGDFFQLEIGEVQDVLTAAFQIKALIRSVETETGKNLDVRMAIGIGKKTFEAERISESNGEAFVFAGEKFDRLAKDKTNLGLLTSWPEFDQDINLMLRLAGLFMDKWTAPSAELVQLVLQNPKITQQEIGKKLDIKQNSVSGRWSRSNVDEILAIDQVFRKKLAKLIG